MAHSTNFLKCVYFLWPRSVPAFTFLPSTVSISIFVLNSEHYSEWGYETSHPNSGPGGCFWTQLQPPGEGGGCGGGDGLVFVPLGLLGRFFAGQYAKKRVIIRRWAEECWFLSAMGPNPNHCGSGNRRGGELPGILGHSIFEQPYGYIVYLRKNTRPQISLIFLECALSCHFRFGTAMLAPETLFAFSCPTFPQKKNSAQTALRWIMLKPWVTQMFLSTAQPSASQNRYLNWVVGINPTRELFGHRSWLDRFNHRRTLISYNFD